jgi:hypothetical protein
LLGTSFPPINGLMSLYQQLLNLISDSKKHHLFDIAFYLSQKPIKKKKKKKKKKNEKIELIYVEKI